MRPGDVVLDATCGNGHDTCVLAGLVGPSGTVHAVDLHASAIASTRARLAQFASSSDDCIMPELRFHEMSHERIGDVVEADSVSVVAFNLGYLPHAERSTATRTSSTLQAVSQTSEVWSVVCSLREVTDSWILCAVAFKFSTRAECSCASDAVTYEIH